MPEIKKITGNKKNLEYLEEAYLRGKLSHAYIIEGADDSGKEDFALHLAAALLCDRAPVKGRPDMPYIFDAAPCCRCPSCLKVETDNHPDLIIVRHEKENLISVREVREQVVSGMAIKPYYGKYKIYIIPDAQLMNESGQNALLKTIEEPPEYGLILLLTDNAAALLDTIRSRCIRISMEKVPKEKTVADLLSDKGEEACRILSDIGKMDAHEINDAAKELEKADGSVILRIFEMWFRDVLVLKSTNDKNRLFFSAYADIIDKEARRISYEGLNGIINAVSDAMRMMKASVKGEGVYENLMFVIRRELK